MANKPALRIASVGRNVSAAFSLLEQTQYLDLNLSWFQTQKDRLSQSNTQWLLLPKTLYSDLFEGISYPIQSPTVFLENKHKYPLNELLKIFSTDSNNYIRLHNKNLKLWHIHKLISWGLCNDLSPAFWKKKSIFSKNKTPNVEEFYREASSFRYLSPFEFFIFPREEFLIKISKILASKGVNIVHDSISVLGLEVIYGVESRLVHNSPYGYSSTDKVIWHSLASGVNEELTDRKSFINKNTPTEFAHWKSYRTTLSSSKVSALPMFSVWLDNSDQSNNFLEYCLPYNGVVKQVYAIPSVYSDEVELEIRFLQFPSSFLSAFATKMPMPYEDRIDRFLWDLCPELKNSNIEFHNSNAEEFYFPLQPDPHLERLGKSIHYWWQGNFGSHTQSIYRLLSSYKKAI